MTRRVFISSASGALAPYRRAAVEVCHRLGLLPVFMEEFDPQRPPPAEVCRELVGTCDVFVLLLAHRYGSRPPGTKLSYTELEYQWALSRRDLPLLPFVVEPGHPWPPSDVDQGSDAAALGRLTSRVLRDHVVNRFGAVERFREDLILALRSYEQVGRVADRSLPAPPALHAAPPYVGSAPFTGRAEHLAELDGWARSAAPMMVVEAIGGIGKSALTWEWAGSRAPTAIDGPAGFLWWSFYDRSASMTRFLQEVLAYTTHRPVASVRRLHRVELTSAVLAELRARPYLIVLDGFERLLHAYHRFDPSKLRDDEVEPDKRAMIDPHAEDVLRALTTAGPSKILISSRLMPEALNGRFGQHLSGVRHLRLPGLSDQDVVDLLARVGIRGTPAVIGGFFSGLGNHPLLAGVVAGLVRDHRPDPGNFDAWRADATAGGAFDLHRLDLTQRRTHILTAALAGLSPPGAQLLSWISVLPSPVEWATVEAVNPFQPRTRMRARLDVALKDLEDRGLLWWDRAANSYDLHPIIRAYVHGGLTDSERTAANAAVADHFAALPPERPGQATSVEDLQQTITLFRALVDAGLHGQAEGLWRHGLGEALLIQLAAYSTVAELLTPSAGSDFLHLRVDLALACSFRGKYDEAIEHDLGVLRNSLDERNHTGIIPALSRLSTTYVGLGDFRKAARCLELERKVFEARHIDSAGDSNWHLKKALLCLRTGRRKEADREFYQAGRGEPWGRTPWFKGDLRLGKLERDIRWSSPAALRSITAVRLDQIEALFRLPQHRIGMARLRMLLAIRTGDLRTALDMAERRERLARNAGLEVSPAESAFLLAKLGRRAEADAAVEETLLRLPRLHPADRPHGLLGAALAELDRHAEARSFALDAYRQAWGDGPPHCRHWELRDAVELLDRLGVPAPALPVVKWRKARIPLEGRIQMYIHAGL